MADSLDTYHQPKEVLFFQLGIGVQPPPPPPLDDDEIGQVIAEKWKAREVQWKQVLDRYNDHYFYSDAKRLDPGKAKKKLDEVSFHRTDEPINRSYSNFLLRFVGESSVVDLWFTMDRNVEVYVSRSESDLLSVLEFKKRYKTLMTSPENRIVKYSIPTEIWSIGELLRDTVIYH